MINSIQVAINSINCTQNGMVAYENWGPGETKEWVNAFWKPGYGLQLFPNGGEASHFISIYWYKKPIKSQKSFGGCFRTFMCSFLISGGEKRLGKLIGARRWEGG